MVFEQVITSLTGAMLVSSSLVYLKRKKNLSGNISNLCLKDKEFFKMENQGYELTDLYEIPELCVKEECNCFW